ncbi:MAG: hypothetical protein JWM21_3822 [Acidobacteria bacterium]|nr:hypothetical protein [Acidobacteriota bacterium]
MELVGNEKKILALFHELKLADERLAPEFSSVWNHARATSPSSSRVFKFSLAAATVLVVITLCSLVFWSRHSQLDQSSNPAVAAIQSTFDPTPAPPATEPGTTKSGVAQAPNHVKSNRGTRRFTTLRHQADITASNSAIRADVSISTWQSPTATLMQSPADDVLTSLPQLDRSLTELKIFLPNTPQ